MQAPSLEQIFQIERAIEVSFQTILQNAGVQSCFISRETAVSQTPYVTLKMVSDGIYKDHQHTLDVTNIARGNSRWVYDTWQGILKVRIVTNRMEDGSQHVVLLGRVRQSLQLFSLLATWPLTEGARYHALTDIRELDTSDSCEDDVNLDISDMNWYIMMNARSESWPIGT